ncbi:hypothetical protein ScPMuIL_002976 [Solemya velum]
MHVGYNKIGGQAGLDDYILHYEPLHYDTNQLHQSHLRSKRSTDTESPVKLTFTAYNRNFHLNLRRDKSIFTRDHKLKESDGSLQNVDTSFIYEGEVEGIPGSFVHGSILRGLFRGWVEVPGDTVYHVEPSDRFFNNTPPFHTVIYSEKHMNLDPYRERRETERGTGGCGYDRAEEWMRTVSESVADDPPNRAKQTAEEQGYHSQYFESAQKLHREKRTSLGQKNTCNLYIQTDPEFYTKWALRSGHQDWEMAKDEILAFIASHVKAINEIYADTGFTAYNGNPSYRGINFQVQRTSIMTDISEHCNDQLHGKTFCNPNIDVSNFLNLHSLINHDEFCLAYVFTYRDFTHGTLGLAWIGSASRASGGICEKFKEYQENRNKVWKSLNTGIVTNANYGKMVPTKVSQLTFAHEVGHNFGSPHDSGPFCAPYGTNEVGSDKGNYIMFAGALMEDKAHKSHFSSCSKDNISRVLDAVFQARFLKKNCFTISDQAFCGNALVEDGEECDCGYSNECTDQCCNAKETGHSLECKRVERNGVKVPCSPTEGPCCFSNCTLRNDEFTCREADECIDEAKCLPNQASCPASAKKADKTYCNDFSHVCIEGNCIGSICRKVEGWEECFLKSEETDEKEKNKLCFLACKKNTTDAECVSSANPQDVNRHPELKAVLKEANKKRGWGGIKFQLPAGSPCDNYRGYCDFFYRCKEVDGY